MVRHERDLVAAHVSALDPKALIVDQDEVPGTGRAVEAALEALDALDPQGPLSGTVVVTYGDVPLLTGGLLAELVADPRGRGQRRHRPHRRARRRHRLRPHPPRRRTEPSRASASTRTPPTHEREIREINSGIYAFDAAVLRDALVHVTTDNAQGEKYLTDVLALARAAGGRVAAVVTDDRWQVEGANDRVQLSALGAEHNRRTVEAWMRAGVTVVDPATTWIDATVTLDEDVRAPAQHPAARRHHGGARRRRRPGHHADRRHGGRGRQGDPHPRLRLHDRRRAPASGPFTYLRPGTVLGETGKIGAFYETKNVTIGRGSKLSHLGYAGDAEIGEDTNIGCGNITANYDGEKKHRTVIGSGVRTGSNTVFVAPVPRGRRRLQRRRRDHPPGRPGRRPRRHPGQAAELRRLGCGQPPRFRLRRPGRVRPGRVRCRGGSPRAPPQHPPLLRHRQKRASNHERNYGTRREEAGAGRGARAP